MARRLVRSPRRGMVGGVATGIGDYFDLDPVAVRLGFAALSLFGGSGVILYLVCWVVMPKEDARSEPVPDSAASPSMPSTPTAPGAAAGHADRSEGRGRVMGGLVLICVGLVFMGERLMPIGWLRLHTLWPALIIIAGLFMLTGHRR